MRSFTITALGLLGLSSLAQAAPAAETVQLDRRFFTPVTVYPPGFNKATCPTSANVLQGHLQTKRDIENFDHAAAAREIAARDAEAETSLEPRLDRTYCRIIGNIIMHDVSTASHNTVTFKVRPGYTYTLRIAADVACTLIETYESAAGRFLIRGTTHPGTINAAAVFHATASTAIHYLIHWANHSPGVSGDVVLFEEWVGP